MTAKKKRAGSKRGKRKLSKGKRPFAAKTSSAKRGASRVKLATMKPKTLHFWFRTSKQANAFVKAIRPLLRSGTKISGLHPDKPGKNTRAMIAVPHHALKKGFNPAGELRRLAKEHGSLEAETRYA